MTCLWPAVINTHRFPLLCGAVQGWVGWGTTRGGQVGPSFQTDLRKYNVQGEAGGGEALRQRRRAGGEEVGKPQPAVRRPRDLQTSRTWASAPSAQGCAPRGTPASRASPSGKHSGCLSPSPPSAHPPAQPNLPSRRCAATGDARASGPGLLPVHPLLAASSSPSCLGNGDPPSSETPANSGARGGVLRVRQPQWPG